MRGEGGQASGPGAQPRPYLGLPRGHRQAAPRPPATGTGDKVTGASGKGGLLWGQDSPGLPTTQVPEKKGVRSNSHSICEERGHGGTAQGRRGPGASAAV